MAYAELLEELTEIVIAMNGYEGEEIDECVPGCQAQAERVLSQHGTEAITIFMAVWENLQ